MFTVIGESLVDLVRWEGATAPVAEHPGGSPANVALGLARLEEPVTLVTRLGQDTKGAVVRSHLTDSGVQVRTVGSDAATGTATAVLDANGGARYEFDLGWDLPETLNLPRETTCLHTGSLATSLDPGATVVEALLERERRSGHRTISFDPNIRPALLPSRDEARARTERQVVSADVVKVSDEDLRWLYPETAPQRVAADWLGRGPAIVVVTLGGDGSLALTGEGLVRRPAPTVDVADTVGAGDAFTAGMLHQLGREGLLGGGNRDALHHINPKQVIRVLDTAAAVAALTCARHGAEPPNLHELATHLAGDRAAQSSIASVALRSA
ncbi:carbohydrate kinase [Glycomyces sp. TRM65418]|uniref:carbohydrate kinase family protein n=1 Tax=Glycomyces sp. TRM65418 TaxID=2867006 RepID=UPI001CE69694|nr:carbohydrate kinase [Glycomyces sp. TRM65418]MCC3764498.1 carbohydrate kinase [Glycomyces sp. TRM65418]QZD54168.1 carbohydrate kinase [Glycomyces sp. TRM65418]